jgi:hypothetical protein
VEAPTVLIISDEVDFSRRITARWQMERNVPTFTLLSGDLWPRFAVDIFDVAIVGDLRRDLLSVVLEPLHSTGQPIFCLCQDAATAQLVHERWPRISILRHSEHWLETLVLAAGEAVHRSRAESRARAAEISCATLDRQATLGRYMVEMRHNLNNARQFLCPDARSDRNHSQYDAAHPRNHAAFLVAGKRDERGGAAGRTRFR